ncbi:hypothetical protein LCGC14_1789660 [marine sediment metagenome]|uniref:Uncharacterized protein n=1 Tax=marine sediment metagenome TaxID=412755 RepID=A0A0F9J7S3_9ZZZZ
MTTLTTSKMDGDKRVLKGNYPTHFFVTAVQTKKDVFTDRGDSCDSRCWGYTDTFEKAEEAVLKNYMDMHECSYQWIIIEEYVMDVLALATGRFQWYHWDKMSSEYERCRQPAWAKQICNWGIG